MGTRHWPGCRGHGEQPAFTGRARTLALEEVGIVAWVVNARHVKAVPGSQKRMWPMRSGWLHWRARACCGPPSIAKADLRSLRHIFPATSKARRHAGQREESVAQIAHRRRCARLGVVVSDLHGQSARAMVKAIIAQKSIPEILDLASNRLRASRQDIFEALQAEEVTPAHRFVLGETMAHNRGTRRPHGPL